MRDPVDARDGATRRTVTFTQHVPPWPDLAPAFSVEAETLEQLVAHPRLSAWSTLAPHIRARYQGERFDGWFCTGPESAPYLLASYDMGEHAYIVGVLDALPAGLPRWPGRIFPWRM